MRTLTVISVLAMIVITGCNQSQKSQSPYYYPQVIRVIEQEEDSPKQEPQKEPQPQQQPEPQNIQRPRQQPQPRRNTVYVNQNIPYVSSPRHQVERNIYIYGHLRDEVEWAVIRELRAAGYTVCEKRRRSIPYTLKIRTQQRGRSVVCTAKLLNADNEILSQGIGEDTYWRFRTSSRYLRLRLEKERVQAEANAALEAVRSLLTN